MMLTSEQQAMLDGKHGWPKQIALRMLAAVGRACDAESLIPVGSVHLGLSGVSMGETGMRFVEALAGKGATFVVPTTLNILSVDRGSVGTIPAIREQEQVQLRIARACETMGGKPTYTCNPFLLGSRPARDESVAWNESATAPYVNSVLGARTNREGATALASAITGFTANYGMHLPCNRLGTVVIEVTAAVSGSDDFNLLGGAVARVAGAHIPVIEGIGALPGLDEMTAFSAAFAAISPMPMVHMVGLTPEASTVGDALAPGASRVPITIDAAALAQEREFYMTARDHKLDVVTIGCPHASLAQVTEVAEAIGDDRIDSKVRFFLQVSRDCAEQVEQSEAGRKLRAAGVTLLSDSCVHVAYDEIPAGSTLATNSLKIAYLTGSHDVNVRFGSLHDCVRSAIAGHWID